MNELICGECKEYIIACEGERDECVVCKECGVPVTSQEIIAALRATSRLSAEDANEIASRCTGGGTTFWADMCKRLWAYADTLEDK